MSEKLSLSLRGDVAGQADKAFAYAKTRAEAWLKANASKRLTLEIRPEKRSDAQNRRLWSMLSDVSQQVDWHGHKLTPDEWKDVFTAALKKQKAVPGIDGGFVVCGQRTSQMTKAEMSELQTLMEAFGAQHGVAFRVWGDDDAN